jgi:hypothetical protein
MHSSCVGNEQEMRVTAWYNGGDGYGVRIPLRDRGVVFLRSWNRVGIELDGHLVEVALSSSFWRSCHEIRGAAIRDWLLRKGLVPWPKGSPPVLELLPLGGKNFRLMIVTS